MPHPSEETSKASLRAWWKQFTAKSTKRENEVKGKGTKGIFGVRLSEGIEYASVPICMAGADGQQYVYGYIPTIVAKCGMFLKEQATTTEGIFRLSGSARRIKELQAIFDSPPSYGKTLTWVGYSVHDAANILRRYLNHLPEPVIPHQWYEQFRSVHDHYTDPQDRVRQYQGLIAKLPRENQHLLLYLLDLLAVFSSKSGQNLMPSKNLASIFQPGVLSHPDHDMAPEEYKLSQEVLEFLIDYQTFFLMLPNSLQSNGGKRDNIIETSSNHEKARSGTDLKEIRHSNDREISGVGEGGSRSLKEPHDLNSIPVTQLSIRRSSLSEHRNKSTDSTTMIQDDNEQGLTDNPQYQDPEDSSLVRKNTGSGLTRSRTLPSQKPRRERTASVNDGSNDNDISRP